MLIERVIPILMLIFVAINTISNVLNHHAAMTRDNPDAKTPVTVAASAWGFIREWWFVAMSVIMIGAAGLVLADNSWSLSNRQLLAMALVASAINELLTTPLRRTVALLMNERRALIKAMESYLVSGKAQQEAIDSLVAQATSVNETLAEIQKGRL